MKILVTGANGYLGQGIVKHILNLGHSVIAADCAVDNVDDHAQKFECNIFDVVNPYIYFGEPDVLLHLAWRDGFKHYSNAHIDELPKHFKFIQDFSESNIKMISGMGTMHEIGFFEGEIKEDTPCNPTTPYGICKNALRQYTQSLCEQKNIGFQWLRGYYIVGNNQYGASVFSKIAAADKAGAKEFPFTMGKSQYDFIDYNDFCDQVAKSVCQRKILGIINICSGHPEKLSDRVERFIRENNYNIKLKYGAYPDRPYDSKAIWGDDTKIIKIMNQYCVD